MSSDQDPRLPSQEAMLAGTLAPWLLLLADDDIVERSTARMLRRAGYAVPEAGDADAALLCMQEHGTSVASALSAVIMPSQSGVELGQAVRARWPHAKTVLISACAPAAIDRHIIVTSGLRLLRRPVTDTPGIVAQLTGPGRSI